MSLPAGSAPGGERTRSVCCGPTSLAVGSTSASGDSMETVAHSGGGGGGGRGGGGGSSSSFNDNESIVEERAGKGGQPHFGHEAGQLASQRAMPASQHLRWCRVYVRLNAWWETPDTLWLYRQWAMAGLCGFPGCPLPERHSGEHQFDEEVCLLAK